MDAHVLRTLVPPLPGCVAGTEGSGHAIGHAAHRTVRRLCRAPLLQRDICPKARQNGGKTIMDPPGSPAPPIPVSEPLVTVATHPGRDRNRPIKVVYIAGDGRSGSTLLDRL